MKLGLQQHRTEVRRGDRQLERSEEHRHLAAYGIYLACSTAGIALDALREAEFLEADISFLVRFRDRSDPPQPLTCSAGLGDPPPVKLPDIGRVLTSGPIRSTLTSVCEDSSIGLSEALVAFGFPSYQVTLYENAVRANCVLVIVSCRDFTAAECAVDVLEETGAFEIGALRRRR